MNVMSDQITRQLMSYANGSLRFENSPNQGKEFVG